MAKREVVDLLAIGDPARISAPAREGDLGLGDIFTFPFQTIESVLPLGGGRLLIANDNNFPFSTGRNAGRPDDNEFIIVRVDGLGDPAPPPSGMPGMPNTGAGGGAALPPLDGRTMAAAVVAALLLAAARGRRARPRGAAGRRGSAA